MNYTIWLQILMELALAVSGEHELKPLLKKSSRAFHRKLDCTHVAVMTKDGCTVEPYYISPKWAITDEVFNRMAYKLSEELLDSDNNYTASESEGHHYYAFVLREYGTLVLARGKRLSYRLIRELEPIVDMLATNMLNCIAADRQKKVEAELREQKRYNEYFAHHDFLTNLPNRRKFTEILKEAVGQGRSGAVVMVDLDNFKGINDTLGHIFGDKVLVYLAEMIMEQSTDSIIASRFGGDEFQFLILEKSKEEVEIILKKVYEIFSGSHTINKREIELAFSAGITMFPQDSKDVTQLIMNADVALYSSKKNGKNAYRFFDSTLSEEMLRKLSVEIALKKAVKEEAFNLAYQPQVDVESGEVAGYEALLRMADKKLSPAEFIPVAEESKLILKVGRIVTRLVIEQIRKWQMSGRQCPPIAINFSAAQIYDYGYLDFLLDQLDINGVDPSLIELEITENLFIGHTERPIELLNQFRDRGIKVAIDDFGTGYSSLNYLITLPIDKLKLDRSIIEGFVELDKVNMMESLIALAHSLGFDVVAEGVETIEQYDRLLAIGCDYIQGFLFSKPIEEELVADTFGKNYLMDHDQLMESV